MFFDLEKVKKLKRPIVFTNGCYDLFHYGHLYALRKAKEFGESLVVAVNSNKSTSELKGSNRPIIHDFWRLEIVRALKYVDYGFCFHEPTVDTYLKLIQPDYYVKGSEWKDNLPEILENTTVKFIDRVDFISTSEIIDDIINRGNKL